MFRPETLMSHSETLHLPFRYVACTIPRHCMSWPETLNLPAQDAKLVYPLYLHGECSPFDESIAKWTEMTRAIQENYQLSAGTATAARYIRTYLE